jgi:hypothetical protein
MEDWVQAVSLNLSVLCMKMKSLTTVCLEVNRRIAVESFVCICQQARPGTVFHHFLGFMWAAPKGELCCCRRNPTVFRSTLMRLHWLLGASISIPEQQYQKSWHFYGAPLPSGFQWVVTNHTVHLGTTEVEKAVRINLVSASLWSKVFVHRVQSLLNFIFQTHSRWVPKWNSL